MLQYKIRIYMAYSYNIIDILCISCPLSIKHINICIVFINNNIILTLYDEYNNSYPLDIGSKI